MSITRDVRKEIKRRASDGKKAFHIMGPKAHKSQKFN